MNDGMNTTGMGITSIWDIIVLVIVARLFGFGLDGQQANGNGTTQATTEAQIERAIRAAQDTQNTQNALATALEKLAVFGSDLRNGQTQIIDGLAKAVSDITGNQNLVALQAENRTLARELQVAETALNNCNQTAAVTQIVQNAVTPLAQAISSILGQLNCGVKAIPFTPSVPADLPPLGFYQPTAA